jgi:hypothetical protein
MLTTTFLVSLVTFNIKVEAKSGIQVGIAVDFLISQFNSQLSLCREAPHVAPDTYWLVSDNLWAYKALEMANRTDISSLIRAQLIQLAEVYNLPRDVEGLPISYAHEAVLGRTVSTPFRTWNIYDLVSDTYVIKSVVANGTVMADWDEYADLLLYASLSSYWRGNKTVALKYFNKAQEMWDGKGLYDMFTKTHQIYEVYKPALLLYTSKVLGVELPFKRGLLERIQKQQDPSTGGIIVLYRLDGTPIGDVNTETTSIVIIAILTPPPVITATIDIDPDTLNLKSNGEWVTAYITLPEDYLVEDINVTTIKMSHNDFVLAAEWVDVQDGVLMVKFDRIALRDHLGEADLDDGDKFYDITLTVTGKLVDETPFEGSDTITVIKK